MFRDDIVKGDRRGTRVGGRSEIRSRGFREADKTWGSFPRRSGNTPHHREEIDWCNIEVRRLFTSIYDEDRKLDDILKCLIDKDDIIFGATREYCVRRCRVNALLLERIGYIFSMDGFTGSKLPGSRKGSGSPSVDVGTLAGCTYTIGGGGDDDEGLKDGGGEDIDEADTNQLDGLINFVSSL